MSEKNPTDADGSTGKTTQEGEESSAEVTCQPDTSQSIEKDRNQEDGRQNDEQLARDTGDLAEKQNSKEPPNETKEPGPRETIGHGPAQGPDVLPTQNQNSDPSLNQESKETQGPSPPVSGEPPSGNQESESMGTQQPSPSQTQNPADKTPIKQNAGQQPTEQGNPQETGQPVSGQQESDQQPVETGQKHSDLHHSGEMDSQENNEINKNDHKDSTPPTKPDTTNVEASPAKSEGETAPAPDDIDGEDETKATDLGTPNQPAELTMSDETAMEEKTTSHLKAMKKQEIPDTPMPPCDPDPSTFIHDKDDETTRESEKVLEKDNEERDESSGEKNDKPADPSVSTETTGQDGEGQTLQNKPNQGQGEEDEHEVFQEQVEPHINVVFIETSDEPAIEDLLKNCQKYEDELRMGEILKGAVEEYKTLLKKAKETGCQKQKSIPPPSELNSVNDKERNQAPLLHTVIAFVSKKVPSYNRWREAVSEFIILTTLSQSEPPSSQKKRSNSQSGYQNKSKPSAKSYNNNIEKLLDQDWGPDRAPGPSVYNDYRHLFTCESVLRSTFPEADIFSLVDSKIRGPEDVPPELRHKALFHFLLSFNRKKYGVEPSDAWRDFGRLVLAEKQLDLARKAQGPDLHQNVIVKRLDFYKMQNELKEKTEEVEELSTRLSKFASQQLTEGNPNIADLSDTHRPTRLGEMYSQLFDDEWSEAFEAFKDSTIAKEGDDDDELYPNILSILQTLVTEAFSFCREKSCEQLQDLENKIKEALKQNTADTPQTKTSDSEEKMEVDQSPPEAGDNKVEKPSQGALDQTVERHSKELRKAASAETVKYQAQIFIKERLPNVLQDDKVRQDQRVISYVQKCVELCWFMNVQDPPMELVAPKEGEDVDKNLFSHHGRKGKKVQTCVWAALLLHKEGPVVCKGYILPKPK